jgi:hypothetical protein
LPFCDGSDRESLVLEELAWLLLIAFTLEGRGLAILIAKLRKSIGEVVGWEDDPTHLIKSQTSGTFLPERRVLDGRIPSQCMTLSRAKGRRIPRFGSGKSSMRSLSPAKMLVSFLK